MWTLDDALTAIIISAFGCRQVCEHVCFFLGKEQVRDSYHDKPEGSRLPRKQPFRQLGPFILEVCRLVLVSWW